MSVVRAGILFVAIVGVATFFGFTKLNPFSNHFELQAQFQSAKNLKSGTSEVRIAGIEVGRIKSVEALSKDTPGAIVTMDIEKSGLPIHEDAELKVRPLLFLEGNYFVDLKPGSPSAPTVKDGHTIPITQTAIPVQFGDLLTTLQSDTRKDLRTLFSEYAFKGLNGGGAEGFNESIDFWEPAYRSSSLVNDASLGQRPGDLNKVVAGQQKTLEALVDNKDALQGTISNLNTTANALAREDDALQAAIPALRDVLTLGPPALRSLNSSLPSVSAFARDALPGVRSSGPTLDALIPFVAQLRALVQPSKLRGLVADLRPTVPALARLNQRTVPVLAESRALSACTNNVLNPFAESPIPNPDASEQPNDDQLVMRQLPRSLVGLGGESRIHDADSPQLRANFSGGLQGVFLNNTETSGDTFAALPQEAIGTRPALPEDPDRWDFRPDVPCETQEPPNLEAPLGGRPVQQEFELTDLPLLSPREICEIGERLGTPSPVDCDLLPDIASDLACEYERQGAKLEKGKVVKIEDPAAEKPSAEECVKKGKADAAAAGKPVAPADPAAPPPPADPAARRPAADAPSPAPAGEEGAG